MNIFARASAKTNSCNNPANVCPVSASLTDCLMFSEFSTGISVCGVAPTTIGYPVNQKKNDSRLNDPRMKPPGSTPNVRITSLATSLIRS